MGKISCSAASCKSNTIQNKDLGFFRYPVKNRERYLEWLHRTGRLDLLKKCDDQVYGTNRLCSIHFSKEMFMNSSSKNRRLIWNAVPNINLGKDYLSISAKESLSKFHSFDPHETKRSEKSGGSKSQVSASSSSTLKQRKSKRLFIKRTKKLYETLVKEEGNVEDGVSTYQSATVFPENIKEEEFIVETKLLKEPQLSLKPQLTSDQYFPALSDEKRNNARSKRYASNYKQTNIIKSLAALNVKSRDGWTETMKEFSFIVYHRCMKEYDFLSSFFSLPALNILQDWVGDLFMGTGFQVEVLNAIQHRLSQLKGNGRLCSLSLKEIPLRKELFYSSKSDHISGLVEFGNFGSVRRAADSAIVLIASGLHNQWTQPVVYFLKSKHEYRPLKYIILECLTKLDEIDLKVRVFVCDPSKENKLLLNDLGVSEQFPFFFNNEVKIFCMHNPSSLKASFINTLKKHDIHFGQKTCKWEHVEEFYKLECNMAEKFSFKTEKYSGIESAKKNLSFNCLDKPVLAGIYTLGKLSHCNGAEETGEFLSKMHDVYAPFDCHSETPLAVSVEECENEIEYLKELLKWIKLWKVDGITEPLICQDGWCTTVSCLLQMFEEQKDDYKSCKITAKCLNQISFRYNIELGLKRNIVDGKIVLPSVRMFEEAYKTYLRKCLFKPIKKLKIRNSLEDFFLASEDLMNMCKGMSKESMYSYHHLEDIEKVSLPPVNRLAFIGVNIIKKLRLVVFCKKCLGELVQEKILYESKDQGLQKHKTYSRNKDQQKEPAGRTIVAPHKKLLKIMPKFESSFLFAFKSMYHMPRVKMKIHHFMYNELCNEFSDMNIDCEEVKKIVIGLFINISLDHIVSMLKISGGRITIPDHL